MPGTAFPHPPRPVPVHVYVHIPFCHRICPYCSFYKHTPGDTDLGAFLDALVAEARARGAGRPAVTTLYLGGGTPSMLSPTHLRRLFEGLRAALEVSADAEVTLEANPATFTARTAAVFRDLGVTRVSLGAQSFHPAHLATLGREHGPHDIVESVQLLRSAGLPSINIDLIFSIPGQSLRDWEESLDAALALGPDHLSAYNLTYEEDTAFFESFRSGRFRDDPDLDAAMFTTAEERLAGRGFEHYETSNYARPGHRSRHNRAYWTGADYLGLGPSAVSTLEGERTRNIPDTARYIDMISKLGHAAGEAERIGPEEFRLERLALLLRTAEGVPTRYLAGLDPARIAQLVEDGLAETGDDRLRLTGRGPLLVDSVVDHLVG
ncbi:MAG: radical SAM family heme chaperone HemW [Akkermansiaceae bacterium]|nr:radical SAM family heme chaperone HemW [Akkermansiaceae bacterium]